MSDMIIVFIFGIMILLLLIILFFVNRLIQYKKGVEYCFCTVSKCLEESSFLIEETVLFLGNHLEHEEDFSKQLKQTQDKILEQTSTKMNFQSVKNTMESLLKFVDLEEVYPFLKKNDQYKKIKKDILDNQSRFAYAIEGYNKEVERYDNYKKKRFIQVVDKIFRFPNYDYYNK